MCWINAPSFTIIRPSRLNENFVYNDDDVRRSNIIRCNRYRPRLTPHREKKKKMKEFLWMGLLHKAIQDTYAKIRTNRSRGLGRQFYFFHPHPPHIIQFWSQKKILTLFYYILYISFIVNCIFLVCFFSFENVIILIFLRTPHPLNFSSNFNQNLISS